MIKQISHISLKTHSINNVINFYIKILGFKISHKFINKKKEIYGLFIYCGNRTLLEFFLNNTKKKNNSPIKHICFEVKKIRQLAKKLKNSIKILKLKEEKLITFYNL